MSLWGPVPRCCSLPLLAACLVLGEPGCLHRPGFKEPPLRPPETYAGAGDSKAAPAPGRWWKVFGDPQLDRLIRRALSGNLDLETAGAKLEYARASLRLANAGWWPGLSAKGEVGRSQSTVQLPSFTPGTAGTVKKELTRDTYSLSLAASYEVDLWGKVRHGARAARHTLVVAEEDLQAARISLAAQMADTYFLVVELRSQIRLLDRTIEGRRAQRDLVRRRYHEGVVTALDLYQAEENLARALAQRATYTGKLATTEHAAAILLGIPPRRQITGSLDQLPARVRSLPPGLPAQLLLRRPDLRAAHARLQAADATVGQAVAAHYPSLSLSATVGASFDPTSLLWSVLGSLAAPLFNGFAISAQVEQKEALLRQQIALYKATLLTALQEVEDALADGQALEERVRHLTNRVAAAEGALRLAIDQYRQGLTGYLTVLTTELSVYTARSELISAHRELISARIQLARALGGGWTEEEKGKPLPAS